MEKLDFQAIVDSKYSFHCNDHIALFCNFDEVRNLAISDVLVEGFLFAVVLTPITYFVVKRLVVRSRARRMRRAAARPAQ